MAIYSLQHKSIGLSTHPPGTAAAHIRYIMRAGTVRKTLVNGYAGDEISDIVRAINKAEKVERRNARMLDKIMVALPLELTEGQREKAVTLFLKELTDDQVPWVAAFHDLGKDASNPHSHIAIRDRHLETGRVYCDLNKQGSTQKIRVLWQDVLNRVLAESGVDVRVDHRSLQDQGIDRKPGKHQGPIFPKKTAKK